MRIQALRLIAFLLLTLTASSAFAQYYEYPPPRHRRYYYYAPPPPWVRPPRFVRGFFGVSGFGTIIANQDGGVEYLRSGGGFGIFGGLDFGRFFGVELGYDASFHNPIATCNSGPYYSWCGASFLLLEGVHLDAIFHIPTGTRVMPFFKGGGVASWIGRTDSPTDATGGGFEAGGGLDIWIDRHATFGITAMYRGLEMSDYATYTGTGTYLSLVTVGANFTGHFW